MPYFLTFKFNIMADTKYFTRTLADMAQEHNFTSFELCRSTKPGKENSQFIVTDNGLMFRAAGAEKLPADVTVEELEFVSTDEAPDDWCLRKKNTPGNVVAKFKL
jgi:hypothetical protein